MKFNRFISGVAFLAIAIMPACTDSEQPVQIDGRTPLNVNIHSGLYTRRGVITESYLPNASVVGIFLQKNDGTQYDNLPYDNIPYVARGTAATQTWAPQSAEKQILLSATEGKAYAYFPYNAENTSFTAIHLDASRQDDVMYTSTASTGLNDKNADASFNLQHALAVMKVKVKKGSYTGTGAVTSCSISGDPIGLTGTLDGTTGDLSGVTKGKVSADKSYTISNTATDHDIIFVPTTTAGLVTVGLMMDGKEYTTTTTSSEIFSSNQCYTLNLTVDDSGATLTGIEVGDWTMSGEGNSIMTAGGYKISFAGDYAGMAFSVSESGGDVTILASGTAANTCPKEVTATTSITQSANAQTRTITIPSINSDVILTFSGMEWSPSSLYSWEEVKKVDGVYGIIDNQAICLHDALSSTLLDGVAIVMLGRAMQISNVGLTGQVWGGEDAFVVCTGQTGKVGGGVSGYCGWLPKPDGSYDEEADARKIEQDYILWLRSGGALSDTAGWNHTKKMISKQTYPTYLGPRTTEFRNNSSVNQGYTDWFVPAPGQLAYMYRNVDAINMLLCKCRGGAEIPMEFHYSSFDDYVIIDTPSTHIEYLVWRMDFPTGALRGNASQTFECSVRFLRDLN